ncbi:MAG: hypothetical protein ACD_39C00789G0001 [uncultured bacterium]|nr:MAG: hypothetical protein ACD_39C00789G0001 [uncultured bacterium]
MRGQLSDRFLPKDLRNFKNTLFFYGKNTGFFKRHFGRAFFVGAHFVATIKSFQGAGQFKVAVQFFEQRVSRFFYFDPAVGAGNFSCGKIYRQSRHVDSRCAKDSYNACN